MRHLPQACTVSICGGDGPPASPNAVAPVSGDPGGWSVQEMMLRRSFGLSHYWIIPPPDPLRCPDIRRDLPVIFARNETVLRTRPIMLPDFPGTRDRTGGGRRAGRVK
jgi:hypothetical protein